LMRLPVGTLKSSHCVLTQEKPTMRMPRDQQQAVGAG
jgi:hypothetical protein